MFEKHWVRDWWLNVTFKAVYILRFPSKRKLLLFYQTIISNYLIKGI
jgi:hypothetical protein